MSVRKTVGLYTCQLQVLIGLICLAPASTSGQQSATNAGLHIRDFQPVQPICRAGRDTQISAVIENRTESPVDATVSLALPSWVHMKQAAGSAFRIQDVGERRLTWSVFADHAGTASLELSTRSKVGGATGAVNVAFLAATSVQRLPYIPEPEPVKTDLLVGALACPLWEADRPEMWANILKHPERTPALGFYAQENPQVADWETKWATEHGIDFFIYCWYRNGQGGPVKQNFGSAIHQGLFHSRFRSKMHYAIMWENQARGIAGVSSEQDLFDNLFPFWMANYFKDPGYQKIDNRPVLYIYRPEFLVQDLGGVEKVRQALDKMRQKCIDAGFSGLYILGEYRGLDPAQFELDKSLGLDATFPYCLGGPDKGTDDQIIASQLQYDTKAADLGILPKVTTVSQAWSGWNDEGPLWKISPTGFEALLTRTQKLVKAQPTGSLSSRLLLLDNWNEWGEGHYIAPYREYGFGYLDAVRKVFAPMAGSHTDLLPEDIGLGPYDSAFRVAQKRSETLRELGSRRVLKPGGNEPGLIGWWSFDETIGSQVAQDDSGHRLGGVLHKISRTAGVSGNGLLCDGGCVMVGNSPLLTPENGISVECWVITNKAGQTNNWLVNRVLSGGTSTGYRLGLLNDRPCFEVPLTDFSHHLTSNAPLPLGKWVHICGTFDNKTIRLYVDGALMGEMERPGPVRPNNFDLCIGNYTEGHMAHFYGVMDEVKLYNRALSQEEVNLHCRRKNLR